MILMAYEISVEWVVRCITVPLICASTTYTHLGLTHLLKSLFYVSDLNNKEEKSSDFQEA